MLALPKMVRRATSRELRAVEREAVAERKLEFVDGGGVGAARPPPAGGDAAAFFGAAESTDRALAGFRSAGLSSARSASALQTGLKSSGSMPLLLERLRGAAM